MEAIVCGVGKTHLKALTGTYFLEGAEGANDAVDCCTKELCC